jgi:hypothetical protein
MTSPLRKRPPITVRARSTPPRLAASLVGLGLLLAAASAPAQQYAGWPTPPPPAPGPTAAAEPALPPPGHVAEPAKEQILYFSKQANPPAADQGPALGDPEPAANNAKPEDDPLPVAMPSAFPQPGEAGGILSFRKEANRTGPDAVPAAALRQRTRTYPTAIQGGEGTPGAETAELSYIQLNPPGPERLFRLESDASLQERMRQEARQRVPLERITFPEEAPLTTEPYRPRKFPLGMELVEPHYVCYHRLLFEEVNSERYGWDLGFIQPVVSAGAFYKDFVLLPYHIGTRPCQCFDCSSGYCLPGDAVPYLAYPPEVSLTGAAAEVAWTAILFVAFP